MGEVWSLGAAKISVLILLGNWVVCRGSGGGSRMKESLTCSQVSSEKTVTKAMKEVKDHTFSQGISRCLKHPEGNIGTSTHSNYSADV